MSSAREHGNFMIMAADKLIFAGPSFSGLQKETPSSVSLKPPCKQGDIYLASLQKPSVIAIVDGYFDGVPSVWHKEILWALSQGIHVLGAASMGALRAAETDSFGMKGIGAVYESYRDGVLEDDDEVALLHGPCEMDFVPLSLAMVNVRATVAKAVERDKISDAAANRILQTAKSQFYKTRTWKTLLERSALDLDGLTSTIDLTDWLSENEVDQKKHDAEALYDFVLNNEFSAPFQPAFVFEETEFWHQRTRKWAKQRQKSEADPNSDGFRLFG
jgi:hypothetical protein